MSGHPVDNICVLASSSNLPGYRAFETFAGKRSNIIKKKEEGRGFKSYRENKNTGSLFLQLSQKLVQQNHLSRIVDQVLVSREWGWFGAIEEIWVVCTFSKVHKNVHQPSLLNFSGTVYNVNVLHQDLRVPLTLHLRQSNVDLDLFLRKESFLDIGLDTAQKKRLENTV